MIMSPQLKRAEHVLKVFYELETYEVFHCGPIKPYTLLESHPMKSGSVSFLSKEFNSRFH